MTTPVIYEVNVAIDPSIEADYRAWLAVHVRELLALPGFVDARVFDVLEPRADDGWVSLSMQYRLVDATALDAYLRDHAMRMRADGVARFGDRFRATRRVLREQAP